MCGVIVVDVESFQSTCRGRDAYIQWSCLDILISICFSINCSTVICSPTVEFAILREATSETYGPRVYFPSYKFPIYFTLRSLLSIYIIKIPKIFILLSLSYLTFASGREGIDNPFIALVARFLFVCVGTRRLACCLLLDWYLGSQKLREILTLLCCITLPPSRETQRMLKR